MNTVIKIGIGILVGAAGALGGRALVERRRGRPAPLPEVSPTESVAPNGATAPAMPASDALEAS
jgi:hypothetical protein